MSTRHRVTVYSITELGVHPQYYAEWPTKVQANAYAKIRRDEAARAGVLIRVDFEEALPASRDELKARDEIKREVRK